MNIQKPQLGTFSGYSVKRGEVILQIEKMYACAEHRAEHNEPAVCARTEAGHIPLNHEQKKTWADAIVSKHNLPCMIEH